MIHYHIKGFYKAKTKSNFSRFFFSHWLLRKYFFSFVIKAFANFEKLIRLHWQAFTVYINGENLKMLIQIFCKLLVSNFFWPFYTIWNLNFSSSANHGGRHRAPTHFKISGSAPVIGHSLEYSFCQINWNSFVSCNVKITRTSFCLLCALICTFYKNLIVLHHGDNNFLFYFDIYIKFTLS